MPREPREIHSDLIEEVRMECQHCAMEFDAQAFTDPATGQSDWLHDSEHCPFCGSANTVETR